MVLDYYSKIYNFVLLAVIFTNIFQRKIPHTDKKRKAPLYIAIDMLAGYFLLFLRLSKEWPVWLDWIILAVTILVPVIFHKVFWPYKFHCAACGKKLGVNEIIGGDENFCQDCFNEAFPEIAKKREEKLKTPEERLEESFVKADKVDDIPWESWEPTERCVLTYLIDGDRVLLIEKKTGLGSGYYNAPGGHIELEETKVEAAIRETKEETGLDVSDLEERGCLYFQFKDGLRMIGYVFFTHTYSGEIFDECEETRPFWCDIKDIDYSKMWEDDKLWLPMALEGKYFDARFIFDDLKMLDQKIIEIDKDEL